jgi:hypothetical protein
MADNPGAEQEAVTRLRAALTAPDTMTREEAQALLPALIEAEQAGEDVDNDPTFAALLHHLDHDPESMALYLELAEDLAVLMNEETDLPAVPSPPPFFSTSPTRASEKVVLRMLQGLHRRFELTLALPNLAPTIPTLGGSQSGAYRQEHLFSDTLREMPGTPLVAVSLHIAGDTAELLVAVRDATPTTRWQITLSIDEYVYTASTNDQGLVRFADLGVTELQQAAQFTITCTELAGAA